MRRSGRPGEALEDDEFRPICDGKLTFFIIPDFEYIIQMHLLDIVPELGYIIQMLFLDILPRISSRFPYIIPMLLWDGTGRCHVTNHLRSTLKHDNHLLDHRTNLQ